MTTDKNRAPGPIVAEKAVEAIPLDAVVRAYLVAQLTKLKADLEKAQSERKEAEITMIAQLNRVIGQRDGLIGSLEQQIETITTQLGVPPPPPPDEAVAPPPALAPAETPSIVDAPSWQMAEAEEVK